MNEIGPTKRRACAAPRPGRETIAGAFLALGFALTLVAYEVLQEQFWLLLGIWTGIAAAGVALLRSRLVRTPLLTVGSILALLFVGESALALLDPPTAVFVREGGCWTADFSGRMDPYQAGFGPQEPATFECRKVRNGELIFDVVYGFDEHNLRRTPGNPQGDTVIFFGCSFTFGHGLEDDETVPFLVSQDLGYRYNVVNLGSTDTGPHHMLYALEQGLPDELIGGPVRRVFYTAILDHVYRAGVRAVGGTPRYMRDSHGEAQLVRTSPFLAVASPPALQHSKLAQWIWDSVSSFLESRTRWQLDLFEAILWKSARLVREQYGVPLTVVLWDDPKRLRRAVRKRLDRLGLEVVLVSEILPIEDRETYRLPYDGHPTAAANRLIATRLAAMLEPPAE